MAVFINLQRYYKMDKTQIWVNGLIAGSYKDFTSLYQFYSPQLYAFVFSISRSDSITKDIVQETFIKVWEKKSLINDSLSFKSFLFTIARNRLLNTIRKQINDPVFIEYIQVNIEEEAVDCSYENKIDFDEFNRLLQIAKQKLPPRQAQIFELNKEQALSVQEIAQSLQITEQVVRNQLSVALRLLRNEMKKFAYLFAVFF